MGLPPLAGFMGEWMIFAGAFPAFGTLSTIGVFGIILSNAYFAWLMYRLYIPRADVKTRIKSELTFKIALILNLIILLIFGLYPGSLISIILGVV